MAVDRRDQWLAKVRLIRDSAHRPRRARTGTHCAVVRWNQILKVRAGAERFGADSGQDADADLRILVHPTPRLF